MVVISELIFANKYFASFYFGEASAGFEEMLAGLFFSFLFLTD